MLCSLLRIQTTLIWIRILLFTLILIRIRLFTLIRIQIRLTDLDQYCSKEVMYLKRYFWYILTGFFLSVGPPKPNQKTYFVKFSLLVHFVVLIRRGYRYRSGSGPGPGNILEQIRIRNTGYTIFIGRYSSAIVFCKVAGQADLWNIKIYSCKGALEIY
jgi:hypothetical protein